MCVLHSPFHDAYASLYTHRIPTGELLQRRWGVRPQPPWSSACSTDLTDCSSFERAGSAQNR